jgi:hypothetical protein
MVVADVTRVERVSYYAFWFREMFYYVGSLNVVFVTFLVTVK